MKVTLLMAITLDGKIGKDADHFPDWTGKEDKKLFVQMTKEAGALIMGAKTFDTIGRPLPGRKNIILTRDKTRVSEWDNLVFTHQTPEEIISHLEAEGYSEVILAGGAQINTLFAKAGLIDEVVLTIHPLIFGTGIGLFAEELDLEMTLKSVDKFAKNQLLVKYDLI